MAVLVGRIRHWLCGSTCGAEGGAGPGLRAGLCSRRNADASNALGCIRACGGEYGILERHEGLQVQDRQP